MLSINAVFDGHTIIIPKNINIHKPQRVIVTFLESDELIQTKEVKGFDVNALSFKKTRELLKDCKTSLAEEVISERNSYI